MAQRPARLVRGPRNDDHPYLVPRREHAGDERRIETLAIRAEVKDEGPLRRFLLEDSVLAPSIVRYLLDVELDDRLVASLRDRVDDARQLLLVAPQLADDQQVTRAVRCQEQIAWRW